jgi:hypothetical protein
VSRARLLTLLIACACGGGSDLDGVPCAELADRWRTATFQALRYCNGPDDCTAVGQAGAACECAIATGFGAVNRDSYADTGGPALFAELSERCTDDPDVSWECDVPDIVAECRAGECQLQFSGTCP